MNTKRSVLLAFLFIAATFSYAQEKTTKPKVFKYGKVDPSEFNIKPGGTDSAAAAITLFDVGKGWFELSTTTGDLVYVFERHIRYKIINKTGYDYGNFEIQLYKQSTGEENLEYMDGATYNLEEGKIVTSKLNKEAKFSEKQDKNFTLKKFALPNVKEGAIIEFKYRLKSDFIFTLRSWYFQKEIPVLHSEYEIRIPEYYKYKITTGGYVFINPKQEFVNENFSTSSGPVNITSLKLHYHADQVPGLKAESFITTMQDYISKVGFELSSIKVPGRVYRDVTSTWPQIVTRLKEDENFGLFVNKRGHVRTLLKSIIKDQKDPDTVTQLIFDYVKNNIKWNEENRLYASETNPKTIFDKKTGSSADINLCLFTMLKEADINAFPVLLSTRSNGAHPGFPMLTKFNNVIVVVRIGEKNILLDATDRNHTPGLIAYDALNHDGLKINLEDQSASWISMDDNKISRKAISYILTLDKENKLSGKLYLSTSNYEALDRRDGYLSATNEAEFLKSYKDNRPGLSIKNYKQENLNQVNEPFVENMDIMIEDNVDEAGNLIYFTPLLYEKTKENPFKLEERNFPVDFGYPTEELYRITLDYPLEYQIDKIPKSEKVVLPDDAASFTFMFASEPGKIVISSRIVLKKSLYTPEEYYHLKELFKNIVRKQAEQIVFKKK